MSTHDDEDRDYEVGYGRPPRSGQFKKGQSGNPNGRPKGARGVKASLKRELQSKVTIKEGGRMVKVSKAEAISKRLMASALSGDMKAMMVVLKIDPDLFGTVELEVDPGRETSGLTPDPVDYDILRDFLLHSTGDDDDGTIEDWEIDNWETDDKNTRPEEQGDDSC